MSDSFGAPPPFPPPLPAPARGIPWDDRDRLGFPGALVETIKRVLFEPTAFFRAMPVAGGLGGPLGFGLIVGYLGLAVQAMYDAVFESVAGRMFGDFTRRAEFQRYLELLEGGGRLVATLVLGPVFLVVLLFVGAGITHLFLMLLGGARRGFEATFRVACFIQAAAVFSVLPFCGAPIHAVYQVVLFVIGLAEAHQIGKWTAAGAVLLPGLVICCCCAGILGAAFGGIASLARFAR